MRTFLFCLAMLVSGACLADDLADADKLLQSKSYPQAVQLLARLADAGNPRAQLRLGQVYWYGEGMPVDRAKADALFAKAAAQGDAEAAKAAGLTGARAQHGADIAYWTTRYDGRDLTSGKFSCQRPVIPGQSNTNVEIKATADAVNAWKRCYNGFIDNIKAQMPEGKQIPTAVADLMTDQEVEQAKTHLAAVHKRVLDEAQASASQTLADYSSWETATADYVKNENRIRTALLEQQQRQRENELRSSIGIVSERTAAAKPQPQGR
jgi:hypothetical protein